MTRGLGLPATVVVLLLAASAVGAAGPTGSATAATVTTTSGTPLNETAAVVAGTLEDLGADESAVVWFEYRERGASDWSATAGRTLESTGPFRAEITGLAPGTDYEFRAVSETGSGAVLNLTTPDYPAVAVADATARNGSVVDVQVRVADLGATTATLEVQYREAGTATWRSTEPRTVETTGPVSVPVDGLDPNTTYEYRAFVDAADGDREVTTATTARTDAPLTVATRAPADVNESAATFRGRVRHRGGSNVTTARFRYRIRGWDHWLETGRLEVADDGSFAIELVGLDPNTTYEYQAVAGTADGDRATGPTRNVTTEAVEYPPSVDLLAVDVRAVPPFPPLLEVEWAASDTGGTLSSVTVVVRNASGAVLRRVETPVEGQGDRGSLYLRVPHPGDGRLTVTVVVEDAAGNTARATQSV